MLKFDIKPVIGLHTFSDLEKQKDFKQDIKLTPELKENAIVIEPYRIEQDMIH